MTHEQLEARNKLIADVKSVKDSLRSNAYIQSEPHQLQAELEAAFDEILLTLNFL